MKSKREQILKIAEFKEWAGSRNDYVDGRLFENSRLAPLITALAERVEMLEEALEWIKIFDQNNGAVGRFYIEADAALATSPLDKLLEVEK